MINKNYIQLINITKCYDDGYVAVKNINISINRGEFVTLLGPSGCGKTTILKMLAGFDTPTSGQIIVDGIDIQELPINQRPTATVFQDYALFPNMNVYQNIAYGLKVMRKPLHDVSEELKDESYGIYRNALKKASDEIRKIDAQKEKLLRQIYRVNSLYSAFPKVMNIRSMRYTQFEMKQDYFFKKIIEHYGPEATFKMTRANRRAEINNQINRRLFKVNKPIEYDLKGLNK
jgi:spermidine/putrescine transport system ATP-binding protein